MRTSKSMDDYYRSQVEETAAREAEQWHVVDGQPVWPAERAWAVKGDRNSRIICDPEGEYVPEDVSGDWWWLVVREKHGDHFDLIHFGAYPLLRAAEAAAEKAWDGPKAS